jgi:uroporphyrinogen-III synthase
VRLLLTRPEPDTQRTAAALRAKRHEVVVAPLMHIESVRQAQIGAGPWAAILVTSANAARAVATHARITELRAIPAFAVGQRSAQAMSVAGFSVVISAEGSVSDLATLVAESTRPPARLLYLAGEDRSGDLAGDLRARGLTVETTIVYRAVAVTVLPAAAADALALGVDGVLHFSYRTAQTYVHAARAAGVLASALKPAHFCLSAQVAEPLASAGADTIRVAPQPAESALLGLVGSA